MSLGSCAGPPYQDASPAGRGRVSSPGTVRIADAAGVEYLSLRASGSVIVASGVVGAVRRDEVAVAAGIAHHARELWPRHSMTALASMSTRCPGAIDCRTTPMDAAGRIVLTAAQCACPVASRSSVLVTNMRVRTACARPVPHARGPPPCPRGTGCRHVVSAACPVLPLDRNQADDVRTSSRRCTSGLRRWACDGCSGRLRRGRKDVSCDGCPSSRTAAFVGRCAGRAARLFGRTTGRSSQQPPWSLTPCATLTPCLLRRVGAGLLPARCVDGDVR